MKIPDLLARAVDSSGGGGMQADDGDISPSLPVSCPKFQASEAGKPLLSSTSRRWWWGAVVALERLPILQQHQHGPKHSDTVTL